MISYKPTTFAIGKRERPIKTIKLQIDEKPRRKEYSLLTNKDRYKFLTMIKAKTRNTPEYRQYIEFLKKHCGMCKSHVLPNVRIDTGKKYSIELHHHPFSMFEIADIVLTKRETCGESLRPFDIIEEILELHYDNKVGLVPVDVTSHELSEKGLVFIPLQDVYQRYDLFFDEYSALCQIPEKIEKRLEIMIQLSEKLESGLVMSDMINPGFTYIEVSGFKYPEVPEEWKEELSNNNQEVYLKTK